MSQPTAIPSASRSSRHRAVGQTLFGSSPGIPGSHGGSGRFRTLRGQGYRDAAQWLEGDLPCDIADLTVLRATLGGKIARGFSARDSSLLAGRSCLRRAGRWY